MSDSGTRSSICRDARLPNVSRPVSGEILVVNQHTRTEAERAERASGLERDDAANDELRLANRDRVADREAELRQQLRPHQRAVVFEQRMRVRPAVLQGELAVKRKPRLDRTQLDHFGDVYALIRRPCHRHHLDRVDPAGVRNAGDARGNAFRRAALPRPIVEIRISAAISVRASDESTCRTLWMTDRSATMAPTPMAMQTKKKTSRFQADRVSRRAVRRTNRIRLPPAPPLCHRAGTRGRRPSRRSPDRGSRRRAWCRGRG